MDIAQIDKNFYIAPTVEREGLTYINIEDPRFTVDGVMHEEGGYVRMPSAVAKTVSERVFLMNTATAGGRVRFKSNSPYIAVFVKYRNVRKMSHFALTGCLGLDLFVREYGKEIYIDSFKPPYDTTDQYESVIDFKEERMREFTINMSTYCSISEMYIGIKEGSKIAPARKYKCETPVVFYGSSITQGGCCSRPGNTYEAMLSRKLDFNYINLGFSGSCKAEVEMAEYIASLNMSVFVYDYDHNAIHVDDLEQTHERMFKIIRDKNPTLPILMLSRPKYHLKKSEKRRVEIIRTTYQNAKDNGDENVYFIEGTKLMAPPFSEIGIVDYGHPNDAGFYSMSKTIAPVLKKILSK